MKGSQVQTQALVDSFVRGMAARGYGAEYLSALTSRRAALFRLLAGADLDALLRGRPSPARWRARLPAAFEGTDPVEAAEILAVLSALRAVLYKPWEAGKTDRSVPADTEPAAPPKPALRLPTAAEFREWVEEQKKDPAELRREAERRGLFGTGEPETAALVARRIAFLKKEFGVRLQNAAFAAEKIPDLGIDALAREGRSGAVYLLEDLHLNKGNRKEYTFAAAYCHCLQPQRYPVFNRRVQTALCALREETGFYPFLNGDLRDYDRYLAVLSIFAEACGIAGTPLPVLARYLEALGARLEDQD